MKRLLRRVIAPLTSRLDALAAEQRSNAQQLHACRLQLGAAILASQRVARPESLRDAEFKVFSQFGEDGIIQHLLRNTGPLPRVFVEFGVESYDEANTRFLLEHDSWKGVIIDASAENMNSVKRSSLYWRHDLTAVAAFINAENIDGLISGAGVTGPIGLLSVDIDGNDYWVWKNISVIDPVIVVAEYNSVFGGTAAVSVPYDPAFTRSSAHYSHLYWGCSLKALCNLASERGMAFVGCNSAGNNAFFVKRGAMGALREQSADDGFVESQFRESRDRDGELTFLRGRRRLEEILELPLINVATNTTGSVRDLVCRGDK